MSPRIFDKWGYALKRKFSEAARRHGLNPGMDVRLLDWGCGCGRMAKYLVGEYRYDGIDIDREAIAWCRQNIASGAFHLQGLEARTDFASDTFDAVIGISIFTHLREEEQFAWLSELCRIAKPGAILAVSVNSATSLFNAGNPPEIAGALTERGFCDTGPETMLNGVTADDTYYRNIYHAHDYLQERWSHHFTILEILPAFVANMQDMIFMRPRK